MTILYKESMKTNRLLSLKIGEFVRIAKVSTSFSKGYKPQFTDEIFKIIDIKTTIPRVSDELEDLNGEKIFGNFYPEELFKQSFPFKLNHLEMETLSVELHSSASSKLYPQNTIPSFKNFPPDQKNLEGECELALTEIFPLEFFKITEESFGSSVTKGGKVIDSDK